MVRMRPAASVLLAGLIVLVTACQETPAPVAPASPGDARFDLQPASRGSAPDRVALAREIPGFGGIFFDDGVLTVNLVDPGQRGAAQQALAAFAREHGTPPARIRVQRASYGYVELDRWFNRLWPQAFEVGAGGVVFTDLDEKRNRLVIGVHDPSVMAPIRAVAARLGIPADAVVVEEAEPIRPMVTLRDKAPSIIGGYQIHFGNYVCTLGFNALGGGAESFITNSHCTNKQGEMTGTLYYQPTSSVDNTVIGLEVDDPEYWRGGICPRGSRCRYSDSARVLRQSDRSFSRGFIAKTTGENNGSLDVVGSFEIKGTYDQSSVSTNCPVVGTRLHKVGRTTGWTSGDITQSCFHTGVLGSNIVQLYQTRVASNVAGGDSGSPVFFRGSGDDVTLYGILWGGSSSSFVFSPITNVRQELGDLTVTVGGESTAPTAPAAPSDLSATAVSSSRIDLNWTDNSNNEDGFRIERCQGSSCDNFSEIATVGANVISYSDTGLSASTSYSYRVRAFNSGGSSAYSNTANATTEGAPPPSEGTVSVTSVVYSGSGGPNRDRHLTTTVSVVDGNGAAVSGAAVSILLSNTTTSANWTATGTTGSAGTVGFTLNNAPNGCYETTITNVTADGLEWDGATPANEHCKGT